MHVAGKASDEYPVEARDLNQSFIGMTIGFNLPTGTVYGRLGATKVNDDEIHVWLEGIGDPEASHYVFAPNTRLFFARTTGDWQLRETVQQVLDVLKARA